LAALSPHVIYRSASISVGEMEELTRLAGAVEVNMSASAARRISHIFPQLSLAGEK